MCLQLLQLEPSSTAICDWLNGGHVTQSGPAQACAPFWWSLPSLPGMRMRPTEVKKATGWRRWRRAGEEAGQGLTSSVLYIPMPTPPAGKLYTSHSLALLPSFGVKTILNVPARSTTKSVALYCRGQVVRARASHGEHESTDLTVSKPGLPGRRGHACQW